MSRGAALTPNVKPLIPDVVSDCRLASMKICGPIEIQERQLGDSNEPALFQTFFTDNFPNVFHTRRSEK
jgi:hypothetical protein